MQSSRELYGIWKWLYIILILFSVFLSVNQIFNINFLGYVPMTNTYLYFLLASFLSSVFLIYPATKKAGEHKKIPWYDKILFLFTLTMAVYLAINGLKISLEAWEYNAPAFAIAPAILLWIMVIEAVRRVSGNILALIVGLFSLYPIISPLMPGFLEGQGRSLFQTSIFHVYGTQSIIGLPLSIFGTLIIGFIIFGVVMANTGAGKFFMDIANAILGSTRGGAAKMSVLASAFFGSLSGSPISNVLTTGAITIPLMKKTGYKKNVAGAVEACASTGGIFMPPVMGATAFIMASILGIPYLTIVIAAIVPSILYFLALLIQVDLYAAKEDIKGIDKKDVPKLKDTFKNGWHYLLGFVVLLYFLLVLKLEPQAPYYASLTLLILVQFKKETRFDFKKTISLVTRTGKVLTELVAILASVGFIIGSLSFTGLAQALSSEIIALANGQLIPLLLMGALVAFILGMGVTITAVYVFLAVVLAPALIQIGVEPIAAHFFVLYWGMLSNITPPVALSAFAAASIAESKPMSTAFEAMKMGAIIYFIPFYFVINPTLILTNISSSMEVIQVLTTSIIGIVIMSFASAGYIYGIGKISFSHIIITRIAQSLLFISGVLLAVPEGSSSLINLNLPIWGGLLCLIVIAWVFIEKIRVKKKAQVEIDL